MGDQVLWYPGYDDKFVTLRRGQDIKLYEVFRVSKVNLMLHFGFWLALTMMILTCGCIHKFNRLQKLICVPANFSAL